MERIELLAPAGSMESLIAAINRGADAIYLGGSKFSARAYASNFDNETMEKAVDYAHTYGVKVYVTVNTLIKENEFQEAVDYIGVLYKIGVDALIIQDVGLAKRIREVYPDFELHASTQMSIHNGEGALFFREKDKKETKGFLLSPKDICTIENVEDLIKTGTSSLKVEGRMKRPEYVAGVIESYREAIDNSYRNIKKSQEGNKLKLKKLFNR
ncbi:MAG: peptidase U32 family protein, partial [Clostridium perfringens]|nr:peptidase U32 family protein [Clostridium perfringens]